MCPPLIKLNTKEEYRNYYIKEYCDREVHTFDKIRVYFRKSLFEHCFFESTNRNGIKDTFSVNRAERIGWIEKTLINPSAKMFHGWDKGKRRYDKTYRVAWVYEDYVVVVRLKKHQDGTIIGDFVTAYVADNSISKIKESPEWKIEDFK